MRCGGVLIETLCVYRDFMSYVFIETLCHMCL